MENKKFEQVVQKFEPHSKLLRTWQLTGGVSAQVTALEIEQPGGQTKKKIVRQHGARDLQHNPHIAADEFKLLQFVHAAGLPVPEPYYLDQSGEIFSTPYLVLEYIEGKPEFAPTNLPDYIHQFATHLSRIHRIDGWQLSFLPHQAQKSARKLRERPANVDESLDEGHIRATLEAVWPLPQRNPPALLHGDFWPGNLLWQDGQLVAIIDWEDAAIGDPLADLANSRLELLWFQSQTGGRERTNLLSLPPGGSIPSNPKRSSAKAPGNWAFGIDAMQSFTHLYQARTNLDFTHLPYWDLSAALRRIGQIAEWGLDEATERTMRERHRWFVNQAFERLAAR